MTAPEELRAERVRELIERLARDAESSGYHLNPDGEFVESLVRGLAANEDRYGYPSCPCRLASGERDEDLDIICPCYYRDPDLTDHGACYCALYVSADVVSGGREIRPVPERRPPASERAQEKSEGRLGGDGGRLAYPVWRCDVCGYLCARVSPPEVCPICKAKRDRFSRFA